VAPPGERTTAEDARHDPGPDLTIIRSGLLSRHPHIRCGMSTRPGGVSPEPFGLNLSYRVGDEPAAVAANRELFFGRLGIRVTDLAIPGQVHGDTVLRVRGPGAYPSCDALMTGSRGVFLAVTVADCLPVFLFDPRTTTVAVVHAGWRGSLVRVLERTIRLMTADAGVQAADLQAFLGPCAGVCCYEVGREVADQFASEYIRREGERMFLDIRAVNSDILEKVGVSGKNVEHAGQCTICCPGLFHSYRRDGERSGRMMAVVGLEA
jgi:YfiH family protein